jgi:hypothetical protein
MSSSDAITSAMGVYTPPGFITAIPLDTTGDPCGTYRHCGTSGKCPLAWCSLFISVEKWKAKYVAALLPVLAFNKLQECGIHSGSFSPKNFLFDDFFI